MASWKSPTRKLGHYNVGAHVSIRGDKQCPCYSSILLHLLQLFEQESIYTNHTKILHTILMLRTCSMCIIACVLVSCILPNGELHEHLAL